MGIFRCNRCEAERDSKDGDSVVDPTDPCELICEDCLTEEEISELEYQDEIEAEALRDKKNNTPEYQAWKKKRELELL